MNTRSFSVIFAAALFVMPACGGDDDVDAGGGSDAVAADAPVGADAPSQIDATPASALGQSCTGPTCGDGYQCISITGVGSTTEGFCTKSCTGPEDTSCAEGYTGPGTAGCILGPQSGPELCGIQCTDECPEGLSCFDITGGKICAGDDGV